MSISYTTGIPAATHNPSSDQPNMQTNNDNIPIFVARDHVGFNVVTGTSGHHLQVTFDSNNVPVVPTSPPVLFTNTVAGLPQLFFYSGDNAHGASQYTSASNGSTFLLGGIILKWGQCVFGGPTTFAGAFPNNVFAVTFGALSTTPGSNGTISAQPITTSGFTAFHTGGPVTAYYIAIGN